MIMQSEQVEPDDDSVEPGDDFGTVPTVIYIRRSSCNDDSEKIWLHKIIHRCPSVDTIK